MVMWICIMRKILVLLVILLRRLAKSHSLTSTHSHTTPYYGWYLYKYSYISNLRDGARVGVVIPQLLECVLSTTTATKHMKI